MKGHFPGLTQAGRNDDASPDGDYLVRVMRIEYHWHHLNPFYSLHLPVLAPECHRSRDIDGRLYCTVKTLWRLNWFFTDFGYDASLIDGDEVDEMGMIGLKGVLRLSHGVVNGGALPFTRRLLLQRIVGTAILNQRLAVPTKALRVKKVARSRK